MQSVRQKKEDGVLLLLILLAGAWRFFLMDIFAGWEESDYGNLAMVRGVYESGFRHYDMNHMPGYYGLAALGLFFTEDTVWAAKMCSWLGGMLAYGVALFWTRSWIGWKPAILVGLLLFGQAEFSLYSASALREPLYAAAWLGLLWGVGAQRPWLMIGSAVLAFLVRFEAPLAMVPLFLLLRAEKTRLMLLLVGLSVAIFLWGVYCQQVHGTYQFWGHAAAVNVETGLGAEAESSLSWWLRGAEVSASLLGWLLPWRIGWGVWLGGICAPFLLLDGIKGRRLLAMTIGLTGAWLGIGFIAQHAPEHNLYWKWLYPLVPFWVMSGVAFWWRWLQRFPSWLQRGVWILLVGQALYGHAQESQRQIARSQELYAPQVELASWVEEQPNRGALVLDNIPACWINRKPHELELISWFDVPTGGAEAEFAQWLIDKEVWGVLWFAEEWTQAPQVAPFLSEGGIWCFEDLCLKEQRRGAEYGWIFFLLEEG